MSTKRNLADESGKTKKARSKLEQKLKELDERVTQEALEKKTEEITRWIDRHSADRTAVKKDLALFDRNRNSAKESRVLQKLKDEISAEG
jgi:hypothetical protein